jgi:acetyl esterase
MHYKVTKIYPQLAVSLQRILYLLFLIMTSSYSVYAQEKTEIIYKQIDTITLKMRIFYPDGYSRNSIYPAIVFFFGGGWQHGKIEQFEHQA